MTQPLASGRGPGEEPVRDPRVPGGSADASEEHSPTPERGSGEQPIHGSQQGSDSATAPGEGSPTSSEQPTLKSARGDGAGASGGGPEPAGGQRDARLASFAEGGPGDTCPPGPGLAATVAELSGPEWRCAEATDEELVGLLGRWDAVGSLPAHKSAQK
jgi:hypothetical protein